MISLGALEATIDPNGKRNRSMGRELDRISRDLCTNILIHIAEGKIRPEAPMQAAKLASEGGIILRQQMPILRHWKEYKKDKSIVTNYIGKVAVSEIQSFNVTPFKYHSTFLHFLNSNVYALY
jgi:pantothenate kinase